MTTLLKKRLFSSPKAFAETVETHLGTMTARTRAAAEPGRLRAWQAWTGRWPGPEPGS